MGFPSGRLFRDFWASVRLGFLSLPFSGFARVALYLFQIERFPARKRLVLYCISFRLSLPFYVYFRLRSFRFVSLSGSSVFRIGFYFRRERSGFVLYLLQVRALLLRLSFRPRWRVPPSGSLHGAR